LPISEVCPEDFYAALWIGAVLRAGGRVNAFPDDADDLAWSSSRFTSNLVRVLQLTIDDRNRINLDQISRG
jgi:hypothetical protein